MERVQNAFTVDVEDYFQVSAFERDIPRDSWPNYSLRVVDSTLRLLDLMAQYDVRGTFFILGWIATRCPDLVRRIDQAGHTIGSHSYWHRLVYELTPEQFRADLRQSCQALQDLTGKAVVSYRAPSFSVTRRSLWALEILAEEGIAYDSSIYPILHDRYGVPDGRTDIHSIATPHGPLQEFPPAVYAWGSWRLPISGGGYFRLYPYAASEYMLKRVNRQGQPFVFYVHPWELDPAQPPLSAGSRASRFRHRVNLGTTYRKLERLLQSFRFATMEQVIDDAITSPKVAQPAATA